MLYSSRGASLSVGERSTSKSGREPDIRGPALSVHWHQALKTQQSKLVGSQQSKFPTCTSCLLPIKQRCTCTHSSFGSSLLLWVVPNHFFIVSAVCLLSLRLEGRVPRRLETKLALPTFFFLKWHLFGVVAMCVYTLAIVLLVILTSPRRVTCTCSFNLYNNYWLVVDNLARRSY
jgi:hypothetical protein